MTAANVSVVMAARNAADTIEEAIASVLQCPELAQLVVVNDGSTDDTAALVDAMDDARIEMIAGPQDGHGAVLATGLAAAREELVAICDSDDTFPADRLAWQRDWLNAHPDYIAVSGGFASVDPGGRHIADLATDMDAGEVTATLQGGEMVTSFCTWLLRRDALVKSGGPRPWFKTSGDLDLQLRLAELGRIWHEPRVCYFYRLHDQSVTHTQGNARRQFFEDSAKLFSKQRRQGGPDDLAAGRPPVFEDVTDAAPAPVHLQIAGQLEGAAWRALEAGNLHEARSKIAQALRQDARSLARWRSFVVLWLKSLKRR